METSIRVVHTEPPAEPCSRISTQQAIKITGLNTPAAFHALRQALEEAWDPATRAAIPIPEELRLVPLSAAQMKPLPVAAAAEYQRVKESRAA